MISHTNKNVNHFLGTTISQPPLSTPIPSLALLFFHLVLFHSLNLNGQKATEFVYSLSLKLKADNELPNKKCMVAKKIGGGLNMYGSGHNSVQSAIGEALLYMLLRLADHLFMFVCFGLVLQCVFPFLHNIISFFRFRVLSLSRYRYIYILQL